MEKVFIQLVNKNGVVDELEVKDGFSVLDIIDSSDWTLGIGDTINIIEKEVEDFMPLSFEVNDIPKEGSCFAFTAKIESHDLFYRLRHAKTPLFVCGEASDTSTYTIYTKEDKHIGTYNRKRKELYTDSRELFCQMM